MLLVLLFLGLSTGRETPSPIASLAVAVPIWVFPLPDLQLSTETMGKRGPKPRTEPAPKRKTKAQIAEELKVSRLAADKRRREEEEEAARFDVHQYARPRACQGSGCEGCHSTLAQAKEARPL